MQQQLIQSNKFRLYFKDQNYLSTKRLIFIDQTIFFNEDSSKIPNGRDSVLIRHINWDYDVARCRHIFHIFFYKIKHKLNAGFNKNVNYFHN